MKVGDLVKVKKSTTWNNKALPSTAIIVEVIEHTNYKSTSYRIHTGERFFARDLEFLYSSASWSS